MPLPTPHVDPNCLIDPLDEVFWKETWVAVAIHNVSRTYFLLIHCDMTDESRLCLSDRNLSKGLPLHCESMVVHLVPTDDADPWTSH